MAARSGLGPRDLLCVTGSFYLAGIAREILRAEDPPPVRVSRRGAPGLQQELGAVVESVDAGGNHLADH